VACSASNVGSDDWRHAADSLAELEVARALIARVKTTDPSIKRAERAAGVRRSRMSGTTSLAACPTLRSDDEQEHLEAEAGDRLGRSSLG